MSTSQRHPTREAWLLAAVEALRPLFEEHGATIPPLRVSVGWPPKGGTGSGQYTAGICHHSVGTKDGQPQIYISPRHDDAVDVLAILVHELVHAEGDGNQRAGHGKAFSSLAKPLGLEGKMTATKAGSALLAKLALIAGELGPYNHAALMVQQKDPKDVGTPKTSRMRKVWCPESGYTIRMARSWLAEYGAPFCPCHHEAMHHEEQLDEADQGE